MTVAFSPGHITCFFHPVDSEGILKTGSRGVGIRISGGTEVSVDERSDSRIVTSIDGKIVSAPVTENVVSQIAPGRGYDIEFINDLPVSQGFGMSASGAISVALALCHMNDVPLQETYKFAHIAEVEGGGGLGDVSAISCKGHQPVRVKPGIPPFGEIVDTGIRFERLTLAVLGSKLKTSSVLSDIDVRRRMIGYADAAITEFVANPSKDLLYSHSRSFSRTCGLESSEVESALNLLSEYGNAGMCMLGHSIFTDLDQEEVKEILGEETEVYSCSSTDVMPFIRKV